MSWWFAAIGAMLIATVALFVNHSFMQQKDTVYNASTTASMTNNTLTLTSPAFEEMGSIPAKYTCDGEQVNPPLSISGVPAGVKSLVLIMDDPDVPKQLKPDGVFDHWILFNLPAGRQAFRIEEGKVPDGAVVGANGAGKNEYTGPCPPRQYEPSTHRYFFKLYALDAALPLAAGAAKTHVEEAMKGHIRAQAQLIGRYQRP